MHNLTTEVLLNQKQAGSTFDLQEKLILREKKNRSPLIVQTQKVNTQTNAWYIGVGKLFARH